MKNLVEKLREQSKSAFNRNWELCLQTADELEKLHSIIEREAWLELACKQEKEGPYVSFEDYEKLRDENDTLRNLLVLARNSIGSDDLRSRIDAALAKEK